MTKMSQRKKDMKMSTHENITPFLLHSRTCTVAQLDLYIANITLEHDNDRTLKSIYCYVYYCETCACGHYIRAARNQALRAHAACEPWLDTPCIIFFKITNNWAYSALGVVPMFPVVSLVQVGPHFVLEKYRFQVTV